MGSLKDQLITVEETFLSSLAGQGSISLQTFDIMWSSIQETFAQTVCEGRVDEETFYTAERVFNTIEVMATLLIELHESAKEVAESLQHDLHVIFSELSIHDRLQPPSKEDQAQIFGVSLPSYIDVAYKWLLDNLHNPYPSSNVRASIAQECHCARKDVDNWFVDARRRIGWTTLCKERFANKRSRIVTAATHFFKDSSHPLSIGPLSRFPVDRYLGEEYGIEFMTIQSQAEDMYRDKLGPTPLATNLAVVPKDLPTESVQKLPDDQRHLASSPKIHAAHFYPSPDPSPPPSSPCLSHSTDDAILQHKAKRRRRDSLSESESDHDSVRPQKRNRYTLPEEQAVYALPSPPASLYEELSEIARSPVANANLASIDLPVPTTPTASSNKRIEEPWEIPGSPVADVNQASIILPHVPTASATSSNKRKRSWSDNGDHPLFKRPHVDAPLLPVYNDSATPSWTQSLLDVSFDEWLQFNSQGVIEWTDEIQPPVTAETIDTLGPLDVTCFQYDFPYFAGTPSDDDFTTLHLSDLSNATSTPSFAAADHGNNSNLDMTLLDQMERQNTLALDSDSQDFVTSFPSVQRQTLENILNIDESPLSLSSPTAAWKSRNQSQQLPELYFYNNVIAPMDSNIPDLESVKRERIQLLKNEIHRLETTIPP